MGCLRRSSLPAACALVIHMSMSVSRLPEDLLGFLSSTSSPLVDSFGIETVSSASRNNLKIKILFKLGLQLLYVSRQKFLLELQVESRAIGWVRCDSSVQKCCEGFRDSLCNILLQHNFLLSFSLPLPVSTIEKDPD